MRENAIRVAPHLVNEQMDDWIWQSLKLGKPINDQFEALLTESSDYVASFTTCLNLIRQQQAEIDRLKLKSNPVAILIYYLKQNSYRWPKLRHTWYQLKGKVS